jgi:hopanoid biosynthesis associated RND transporter like protein HpnN
MKRVHDDPVSRLAASVARVAAACARRARTVAAIAFALALTAAWYVATHMAIDTRTAGLIASDVPWRQREAAFDAAFPQRVDLIAIVVDGATPELAERDTARLAAALARETALFRSVHRPDGGPFFDRAGLLFAPVSEVNESLAQMIAAEPLLATLAADPSLRGLMDAVQLMLEAVRREPGSVAAMAQPLSVLADTFDGVVDGTARPLSWRTMVGGGKADPRELRRFILVKPVLDYSDMQPGARATAAIRATVRDLGLAADPSVKVRLTGSVPLGDEELVTLAEGAGVDAALASAAVLLLLWLALRSTRLVLAVLVSLVSGLAVTAALALLMYERFNLISVAFAVLFVGLGVDFAIQFCVAYRVKRHAFGSVPLAVKNAAEEIGAALALAAASTALGFYAFAPTEYRGVAELGVIAGTGMLVAFACSITFLPALLVVLRAPAETLPPANPRVVTLDHLVARWRSWILAAGIVVAAASIALLPWLRFDFNPLNLKSRSTESVATLLDLARDPATTPDTIDVLTSSLDEARSLADRLSRLPEVSHAITLASFVPEDQEPKLAAIVDAALLLDPVVHAVPKPPPSDEQTVKALARAAQALDDARGAAPPGVAAPAARLATALRRLAHGTPAGRERAAQALMPGFVVLLDQLRFALDAGPVTLQTLPPEIVRDWVSADGRARIEVFPRGDTSDNAVLARFVEAVKQVAPDATGATVSIQESSRIIVRAFVQAGAWALAAIALLLALTLRHTASVLLTLGPLLLAGLATLGLCALTGFPLNFENVIALPLLFGIGVAFDIYFIMAWRAGRPHLLASSLARAVLFSALTTGTAFGSLWLSHHPGTSSMGKLLALSLAAILVSVLVLLPALLRTVKFRR